MKYLLSIWLFLLISWGSVLASQYTDHIPDHVVNTIGGGTSDPNGNQVVIEANHDAILFLQQTSRSVNSVYSRRVQQYRDIAGKIFTLPQAAGNASGYADLLHIQKSCSLDYGAVKHMMGYYIYALRKILI